MSHGYISRLKDIKLRIEISFLKPPKGFKLPSRTIFAIAQFSYLFRISQLTEKLFREFITWCQVQSAVHITTGLANLAGANSLNNIFSATSSETR